MQRFCAAGSRSTRALEVIQVCLNSDRIYGKMFSLRGTGFPWAGDTGGRWADQRTGEFEANQMIAIRVGDPQGSRPQIAGRLGQRIGDGKGRTRDLKQNLRGERQGAAHSNQRSAGGDIKRCGKLENLFGFLVPAAHKDRYCDRETRPLATLCCGIPTLQTDPFEREINLATAPWGPNRPGKGWHWR